MFDDHDDRENAGGVGVRGPGQMGLDVARAGKNILCRHLQAPVHLCVVEITIDGGRWVVERSGVAVKPFADAVDQVGLLPGDGLSFRLEEFLDDTEHQ